MLEKNSTNKQSRVHVAPAVLFVSQPQLEMHFDDSRFFYFFHTSLKMYETHSINFFHEIFGGITQSGDVWKKYHKWL